jgi:hypothetical protein
MQQFEPLNPGQFYHIYNHGVGGRNLFGEPENYEYFLGLYDKYISPIAEPYAWCLMPNHFHLLVRINVFSDFTPPKLIRINYMTIPINSIFSPCKKNQRALILSTLFSGKTQLNSIPNGKKESRQSHSDVKPGELY